MAVAGLGFVLGNVWFLLAVLFLMGTQSTYFGPIKYGILPEQLGSDELIAGNAWVQTGTFIAILLGTVAGKLILDDWGIYLISAAILAVAVAGLLAARFIPSTGPAAPDLQVDYNPFTSTWEMLRYAAAAPRYLPDHPGDLLVLAGRCGVPGRDRALRQGCAGRRREPGDPVSGDLLHWCGARLAALQQHAQGTGPRDLRAPGCPGHDGVHRRPVFRQSQRVAGWGGQPVALFGPVCRLAHPGRHRPDRRRRWRLYRAAERTAPATQRRRAPLPQYRRQQHHQLAVHGDRRHRHRPAAGPGPEHPSGVPGHRLGQSRGGDLHYPPAARRIGQGLRRLAAADALSRRGHRSGKSGKGGRSRGGDRQPSIFSRCRLDRRVLAPRHDLRDRHLYRQEPFYRFFPVAGADRSRRPDQPAVHPHPDQCSQGRRDPGDLSRRPHHRDRAR